MDNIIQAWLNLGEQAVRLDEEQQNQKFQEHAVENYNWAQELASKVKLKAVGLRYQFQHPIEERENLLTKEWGKEGVPASPAIRSFTKGLENGTI